jgi:hypothetical protein
MSSKEILEVCHFKKNPQLLLADLEFPAIRQREVSIRVPGTRYRIPKKAFCGQAADVYVGQHGRLRSKATHTGPKGDGFIIRTIQSE